MSITLNGTTGITTPTTSATDEFVTSVTAFKNRIINGAMMIDQRNAGAAVTVVSSMYTLDRFFAYRGGFAAGMQVQRVAGFLGNQYSARLQRVSGNTSVAGLNYGQVFESANILDLAGNSVTVSFDVRTGANYSGGQLRVELDTSTAIDQTSAQLLAGSWTGIVAQTNLISITSTATRYSTTFSVPSNMQSMAVQFTWTPTGTAGTNDFIEISGVQLEKGSTATSFDYRPYTTELQLCQRYYWKSTQSANTNGGLGFAIGNGSGYGRWQFNLPVQMRATPTITQSNMTLYNFSSSANITSISANFSTVNNISVDGAASGAVGSNTLLLVYMNGALAYADASAEL